MTTHRLYARRAGTCSCPSLPARVYAGNPVPPVSAALTVTADCHQLLFPPLPSSLATPLPFPHCHICLSLAPPDSMVAWPVLAARSLFGTAAGCYPYTGYTWLYFQSLSLTPPPGAVTATPPSFPHLRPTTLRAVSCEKARHTDCTGYVKSS